MDPGFRDEVLWRLGWALGALSLMAVSVVVSLHIPLLRWHMFGALLWLLVMAISFQAVDGESMPD